MSESPPPHPPPPLSDFFRPCSWKHPPLKKILRTLVCVCVCFCMCASLFISYFGGWGRCGAIPACTYWMKPSMGLCVTVHLYAVKSFQPILLGSLQISLTCQYTIKNRYLTKSLLTNYIFCMMTSDNKYIFFYLQQNKATHFLPKYASLCHFAFLCVCKTVIHQWQFPMHP